MSIHAQVNTINSPEMVSAKTKGWIGRGVKDTEVNDNGHLIFTMTDGNVLDLGNVAGPAGRDGTDGSDGYSPEVTITQITGGHRVKITDEQHPLGQSFDVLDGQGGSGGTTDHRQLSNRDAVEQHPMSAITGLISALTEKQGTISDLNDIRDGAALGATAVQPEIGKGLSTNDYTTADKNKLAGIAPSVNNNISLLHDLLENSAYKALADEDPSYSKIISTDAKAVKVNSIGGKSEVVNNVLTHAAVTEIASTDLSGNILPVLDPFTETNHGVTFSYNNGELELKDTTSGLSGTVDIWSYEFDPPIPITKDMFLHIRNNATKSSYSFVLYGVSSNGDHPTHSYTLNDTNRIVAVTRFTGGYLERMAIKTSNGKASNFTVKPSIEETNEVTTYKYPNTLDNFVIPSSLITFLSDKGYGQAPSEGSGNILDLTRKQYIQTGLYVDGTWAELAAPVTYDVSSYLPENRLFNILLCNPNGRLMFKQNNERPLTVPQNIEWLKQGIEPNVSKSLETEFFNIAFADLDCRAGTLSPNGGVNTDRTYGYYTRNRFHVGKGTVISIDSDDYKFQVSEFAKIDSTASLTNYSGLLRYGDNYVVKDNSYLMVSVSYKDEVTLADISTLQHLTFNITDYIPHKTEATVKALTAINNYVSKPSAELKYVPESVSLSEIPTSVDDMLSLYDDLIGTNVTKEIIGTSQTSETDTTAYNIPVYIIKNAIVPTQNLTADRRKFIITLLTGVHGSEKPSILTLYNLIYDIVNNHENDEFLTWLYYEAEIHIIPICNPYGFDHDARGNARHVDINRNFNYKWNTGDDDPTHDHYRGSAPFSEEETKNIVKYVSELRPGLIIDFHSWGTTEGDTAWNKCCCYSIPLGINDNTRKFIRSGEITLRKMTPIAKNDIGLGIDDDEYAGTIQWDNGWACSAAFFANVGFNSFTSECCYDTPDSDDYAVKTNKLNYVWAYQTLLHAVREIV